MNPLLLVWSAVNRISTGGRVIGEEERISPMQALRAVTIDAAWQVFQEGNRGSVEQGKYADLVILDRDPLQDPAAIRDIEVLETIVGGRTVFQREN
jgi:predicted amidohydrolase YtcJ